jgi:hypothetical protein
MRSWFLLAVLGSSLACGKLKSSDDAGVGDGSVDSREDVPLPIDAILPVDGSCLGLSKVAPGICVCQGESLPDICHNPCFDQPGTNGCPLVELYPYLCADLRSDPDHCGACANVCGPSSVCRDGACTPSPTPFLAAPVAGCAGLVLAAGGGSLFWTDAQHGTVMRAPASGGAPVTLASGQDGPTELGLFGDSLYWLNRKASRALMKVAAAGGTPTVVATSPATTTPSLTPGIQGFVIGADGTAYFSSDSTVYALAPAGGSPSPVVQFHGAQLSSLALDGTTLVMPDVLAGRIYATPVADGTLIACGIQPDGQYPCLLTISHGILPSPIFAEAGRAYWVSGVAASLESVSDTPPGQQPKTSIYSGDIKTFTLQGATAFLAVDDVTISDGAIITIIEAPLVERATGAPLAREPPLGPQPNGSIASKTVTSIAVDDANVFWSTLQYDATNNGGICSLNTIRR